MKKVVTICLLIFGLGIMTRPSSAQDIKIGYVDPQSILQKMPAMAAVQKKLQNYAAKKQQELTQQEDQYQQALQQYQQKQAVLSDDAKKTEQQKLQKMQQQLQQLSNQDKQDVQQKQQDLVGPLVQQVQDAINKVAKKMNLTYVLNTMTQSGDYIILYASDSAQQKYDITQQVENELNL